MTWEWFYFTLEVGEKSPQQWVSEVENILTVTKNRGSDKNSHVIQLLGR